MDKPFRRLRKSKNCNVHSGKICQGSLFFKLIVLLGGFEPQPPFDMSIVRDYPKCGFKPLNPYQQAAVRGALEKPFTLIQGPPGIALTFHIKRR